MKPVKAVGIQYAALPYRLHGRRVEVLLVTSRETRRWVVPKGWPMRGKRPQDAAAEEALEEAGVMGEIAPAPIGSYHYLKRLKGGRTIPIQVIVFPLEVEEQVAHWKEQRERDSRWLPCSRASKLVEEPSLKRLIVEWGRERTPRLVPSAAELDGWLKMLGASLLRGTIGDR